MHVTQKRIGRDVTSLVAGPGASFEKSAGAFVLILSCFFFVFFGKLVQYIAETIVSMRHMSRNCLLAMPKLGERTLKNNFVNEYTHLHFI